MRAAGNTGFVRSRSDLEFRRWLEERHSTAPELWVISAVQDKTRLGRLARLVASSARGRRPDLPV